MYLSAESLYFSQTFGHQQVYEYLHWHLKAKWTGTYLLLFYSDYLVFLYYINTSKHCFSLFHCTLSHIHTHTLMDTPRATWGLVSAPMTLQRVIRLLIIIIIIIVTCRLEKNQPCILMHSYGLNTTPSTKKCKCPRDDVVFYKLVITSGFSLDISWVKFFWERKQDDLAQMYFYLYFYHNLFHLFTVMAGGMSVFLNGAAGYLHEDE